MLWLSALSYQKIFNTQLIKSSDLIVTPHISCKIQRLNPKLITSIKRSHDDRRWKAIKPLWTLILAELRQPNWHKRRRKLQSRHAASHSLKLAKLINKPEWKPARNLYIFESFWKKLRLFIVPEHFWIF